ncbi:hypothetical protein P280DRAFT_50006 [Massarina eburnea CBS 473.64]|uniref:Rhodopsin domain-containing protein n=1 Tax=Massarina eburnea CBS 473.64 TaxID=1395130 RepID=A0A6A6RXD3_9PLEO|nr:hypothetical protein P280DRAFT_50006 [Massarina eburnea CBS 473.64]
MEATPEQMATWPAPNFDNPDSLRGLVIGLTVPSIALVIVVMAIRLYSKGVLRQALRLDDHIMLAAAITSIPVCAIALHSLNYGLALHIWDQKEEWHVIYNKMGFAADILFPLCCSLTKISLCLTYLRLFPSRTDQIFSFAVITFLILYTLACVGLMLFQCAPIRGYWDVNVESKCINMRVTLLAVAILNSISDFLVYLWPAKPLWSLQLPLKQRLGLILLFSVGCVVCVAGINRYLCPRRPHRHSLSLTKHARMYLLEQYFTSYDLLWNASKVYAFMILEMSLGIVCGCLTSVKALLAVFFPNIFPASSQTTHTRPTYDLSTYNRHRTTRAGSFVPLSNVSTSEFGNRKPENVRVSIVRGNGAGLMHFLPDQGKSTAWVGSDKMAEAEEGEGRQSDVPLGVIKVQTVVVHKEEEASIDLEAQKSRRNDSGSENWTMTGRESTEPVKR